MFAAVNEVEAGEPSTTFVDVVSPVVNSSRLSEIDVFILSFVDSCEAIDAEPVPLDKTDCVSSSYFASNGLLSSKTEDELTGREGEGGTPLSAGTGGAFIGLLSGVENSLGSR